MKFSLSTNFDNTLIDQIKGYPVFELYGKLPSDFFGGGRSTYMLGSLGRNKFEDHVLYAKKNGIGFNYLLNAACLDNTETTKKGQRELKKILNYLESLNIESVTVSNPLLLKIIKANYPKIKVRISVFAGVDHLNKAKYWEDLGADVICLDPLTVNREFDTLKSIRNGTKIGLELLLNGNCLKSCPFSQTHMNLLAHSSQKNHPSKGFAIDHCFLECSKMKLEKPVNYIRSDWIRPEDLHFYEEMGYNTFKLVERNLPTEILVKRVKAYSERNYDGNLIDLIQPFGHEDKHKNIHYKAKKFFFNLGFLFRPSKIKVSKLILLSKLSKKRGLLNPLEGEPPVVIDNKRLDGYLNKMVKKSCRNSNCEECGHCENYAEKAIFINQNFRKECLDIYKEIDNEMNSQKLWI